MRPSLSTCSQGSREEEMISLPPGPLLFDTEIYIRFIRCENYLRVGEDARVFQRTILTAVVAAELYAGTHNHRETRALDELCEAHCALGYFPSPRQQPGLILAFCYVVPEAFGANRFRPRFSRSPDSRRSGAGRGHAGYRECRRFARWSSILACARKTLKLFKPFYVSRKPENEPIFD